MKKEFDPIKIIKILPLSNRPNRAPRGPNMLAEFGKKMVRVLRETSVRFVTALRTEIPRVRAASMSHYQRLIDRSRSRRRQDVPPGESFSQPALPPPTSAAQPDERDRPVGTQIAQPNSPGGPVPAWLESIRRSAASTLMTRSAHWAAIKPRLAAEAHEWRERFREACGTQETWRKKTEQMVRPLTSAVRALRRRHDTLVERLNATHAIVQTQQQEITELAFHFASIKTEMAAQKKAIEELTHHVDTLQASIAQTLPTHGTTGQSGPPGQGKRGTTAARRHGPSETGPQSRAEH